MIEKAAILTATNNGRQILEALLKSDPRNANKTFSQDATHGLFNSTRPEERTGSSSFFLGDGGVWILKDFGTGDSWDAFTYYGAVRGIEGFNAICEAIGKEFGISESIDLKPAQPSNPQPKPKAKPKAITGHVPGQFNTKALEWWIKINVTQEHLQFFGAFVVESFSGISKRTGNPYTVKDQLLFGYKKGDAVKIYWPADGDNKSKYVWDGDIDLSNIFGWDQLPETGETCYIFAGEKDCICGYSFGYIGISLETESATLSKDVATELKKRFKDVVVLYDRDKTGKEQSQKLSEEHELSIGYLPEWLEEHPKRMRDFSGMAQITLEQGNFETHFYVDIEPYSSPERKKREELFGGLMFDMGRPVEKPDPRLYINQNNRTFCIGSPGNIVTITGPSKVGKSGVLSSVIGDLIDHDNNINAVGLRAKKATQGILHIDTEQSNYNFYKLLKNSHNRCGAIEQSPLLRSFRCLGFSVSDLCKNLPGLCDDMVQDFGGIEVIILDGGADFVKSVNDEEEANEFIRQCHELATLHNCVLVIVLHLNPGSEAKSRGHLGSQLERKSESTIKLHRETEEGFKHISYISHFMARNAGLFEDLPFHYEEAVGYHVGAAEIKPKDYEPTDSEVFILNVFDYDPARYKTDVELIPIIRDWIRSEDPNVKRIDVKAKNFLREIKKAGTIIASPDHPRGYVLGLKMQAFTGSK